MSLLRIAVPNKGSLAQSAADILRESGYRQRDDAKQLTLTDAENGVEFFYLRPRDIALYVGEGTLDVGITGRDLLRDSGAKADEVLPLGFGRSRFRFAGPAGRYTDLDRAGRRPGSRRRTSGWSARSSQERGIEAEVVRLDGAVETSIQLGVADVIADVVETGSTLRAGRARGVRRDDPGVRGGPDHPHRRRTRPGFEIFRRRIEGVLVARTYVMMDYDIEQAQRRRGRRAHARASRARRSRPSIGRAGSRCARWCRATAPSG